MPGMKQFAICDVRLDRNITLLRLPAEMRTAERFRIIVWVNDDGCRTIHDIAECDGLNRFIMYFNRHCNEWNNLPWPSECRVEGLRNTD